MRNLLNVFVFFILSQLVVAQNKESIQAVPSPTLLTEKWKASWITSRDGSSNDYGIFHFRRSFELDVKPSSFVVNVSADNRYRLYVNGTLMCQGPSRGDIMNWYYETIDISSALDKGKNTIAVCVWNFGEYSPGAQVTLKTGLIVQGNTAAEDFINTGETWRVYRNPAYAPSIAYLKDVGSAEIVNGERYPWGWEQVSYDDSDWRKAKDIGRGQPYGIGSGYDWILYPTDIPLMEESQIRLKEVRRVEGITEKSVQAFLNGSEKLVIPAHTKAKLLLDQTFLTNAYPELLVSKGKGSTIRMIYSEALYDSKGKKGNRNDIDNKQIEGFVDIFYPDGGDQRSFRPLWFRTYRYVQVEVATQDEPLVLGDLYGVYTAYPFRENASFKSDDSSLKNIWEVGWRTARLCAHETYFDCPYYEQLQYIGDTRIQALISLYVDGDDRLVRRAIRQFDWSRSREGLIEARYPSRIPQYIPPFCLYWVNMVHDYWMLRDDPEFVKECLPTVKTILAWFSGKIDSQTGMLGAMPHWNFTDWTPEWSKRDPDAPTRGVPPGGRTGGSALLSLQLAYTLKDAIAILSSFGEEDLAAYYSKIYATLSTNTWEKCWDEKNQLFYDDLTRTSYSQHANIMGILADVVPEDKQAEVFEKLDSDTTLAQATFYYRFYLFRALKKVGLADRYVSMLQPWHDMLDMGLTTFAENPEPTRSDCHAWSASPVYDFLSTVCGIMPAEPGFKTIRIEPHLGKLKSVEGKVPHPKGLISVEFKNNKKGLSGTVILPPDLNGHFFYGDHKLALESGLNKIDVKN